MVRRAGAGARVGWPISFLALPVCVLVPFWEEGRGWGWGEEKKGEENARGGFPQGGGGGRGEEREALPWTVHAGPPKSQGSTSSLHHTFWCPTMLPRHSAKLEALMHRIKYVGSIPGYLRFSASRTHVSSRNPVRMNDTQASMSIVTSRPSSCASVITGRGHPREHSSTSGSYLKGSGHIVSLAASKVKLVPGSKQGTYAS